MNGFAGDRVGTLDTAVYTFPTFEPEGDGTLTWHATTAVTVQVGAGGSTGLGWTYSTAAAAAIITGHLAPAINGMPCMDVAACWSAMHRACRNLGTRGLVMQAICAVDVALWNPKVRLLGISLSALFGSFNDAVPVYGSGGFTTMDTRQLHEQIQRWTAAGCTAMKIKIGQSWGGDETRDLARVKQLLSGTDDDVAVMVDANGGYTG